MIVSLYYYPHGHSAALGDDGNQDRFESEPWYVPYVYWLTLLGKADERTIVHVLASFSGPSGQLRAVSGRQREWPRGPSPDPLAAVYFLANGETACLDLAGARRPEVERYWFQPSVADKLQRGVCTPACKLNVPNVYAGSVGHFLKQVPDLLPTPTLSG